MIVVSTNLSEELWFFALSCLLIFHKKNPKEVLHAAPTCQLSRKLAYKVFTLEAWCNGKVQIRTSGIKNIYIYPEVLFWCLRGLCRFSQIYNIKLCNTEKNSLLMVSSQQPSSHNRNTQQTQYNVLSVPRDDTCGRILEASYLHTDRVMITLS